MRIAIATSISMLFLSHFSLAQNVDGTDLGVVVAKVNDALTEAQAKNPDGFPDLTGVTLELSGTATKSGSGQIKFLVFSIGPSVQSDRGMTLTFKLTKVPATPAPTGRAASVSE